MLNVLYDHQKFTTQRYGGISRYFANLIHTIGSDPEFDYQLGVLYCENHYIADLKMPAPRFVAGPVFRKKQALIYRLNQAYSRRLVKKNTFDIFHPTYYDTYFFDSLKRPFVTTIHDMTYERLPEYFWAHDDLTYKKRLHMDRADRIIAISETTKSDILELTGTDPERISVIYHGIDLDTPVVGQEVRGLPETYLLFVGDRSGYKNFYLFLKAVRELSKKYNGLNVVLSGGGPLAIADREFIHKLGLTDLVMHVHVNDAELHYLYEHALAFVYPSLYEGFGYPILEAFRAACPVVLSRASCFEEIAGDAALFFDKHSTDDFVHALDRIVNDSALRQALVEKGKKRLLDFPLQESLHQTLNLYRSLV